MAAPHTISSVRVISPTLYEETCTMPDPTCDHDMAVNMLRRVADSLQMAGQCRAAVLPDIIRQVKAEAWDEGYIAGHEDARAVQPTYPQPTPNPHEQGGQP